VKIVVVVIVTQVCMRMSLIKVSIVIRYYVMTATMTSISTVSMLMVTTILTSLTRSMYLAVGNLVILKSVSVTGLLSMVITLCSVTMTMSTGTLT